LWDIYAKFARCNEEKGRHEAMREQKEKEEEEEQKCHQYIS
jgi:hypothetical protein